jgi:serine/threonine-protein kinase
VLFEMLTGRRLFEGETVSDVLASVLARDVDWTRLPAGTPPSVRQLLVRCLARDPRRRLRDIGDARLALEEPAAAPAPEHGPRTRRSALPWAIAAAAVVVAAWALWRHPARPGEGAKDVVHLDVAFPLDVEPVGGRQGGIAISPDGSTIAMVGFRRSQRRLFLRRLDTPEATDLGSTAAAAAFSPDSRSVALMPMGALARVSIADGRATKLAAGGDFVSGASLAWGSGHVYYTAQGALWSVPVQGGESRALTSLDEAAGEVVHSDPMVLPGDRTLLFSRLATTPGSERIEAIPVAGGARSVVIEGATTPVWSPTGHLLFARQGAVWAVPFDPVGVRPTGTAVPVIPTGVVGTVRSGSLGYQLAANGTLAFMPVSFDNQRLVSVGRDGSELPLGLGGASYATPRLSPDGRTLAVVRDGVLVDSLDLARATTAVAVPAALGTAFPTWTSDGARILVRRFIVPFWAAADGSGRSGRIPHGDANTSPAAAGPDAGSFVAIRQGPDSGGDIVLMSVEGAFPPKPLVATPAYEGSPHLSPDGRWLAYQSDASGQPEIYVRRYPQLDRAWPVSEGGGVQCRFSPSGREIFYRGGGKVVSVGFDGASAEPRLGRPVPLFDDVYSFGHGLSIPNYDVAPDGRFLMLRAGRGGTMRVVLNWTEELKRTIAAGGVR